MSERFKVVFCEDLPSSLYTKDKYGYDDYFSALVECDKAGNIIRIVGTDGGQPEDQTFGRDWHWVVDEMNELNEEIQHWKSNALDPW